MPSNFVIHTSLLVASVAGVYAWLTHPSLAPYTLQLVGLLILTFAATHWGRAKLQAKARRRNTIPLDLSLLTAAILLLVTETGALASPVIFLLYFLLFAVSMLYEIEATLVLTATLLIYFVLLPQTDLASVGMLGELLGLVMITPLALFTGHEYEKLVASQKQASLLSRLVARHETDTLLFLSTNLKTTLTSALDRLSVIIPSARPTLQASLTLLYSDLRALYRSAGELQDAIDKPAR